MKVIEEPAFQLDNSMKFDALVDREMEALEGGFCHPICSFCNPIIGGGGGSTTTTKSPTTTSTTTVAVTMM